jgi:hypothetical protein
MATQRNFGHPTGKNNADYNPALDRGNKEGDPGRTPALILTPFGVSAYGYNKPGQPENVSYLIYKGLK